MVNKLEIESVIIVGTTICPFCTVAKDTAKRNGLNFEYKVIDRGEPADLLEELGTPVSMEEAIEIVGRPFRTVPQIIVDGKYIGGSEEFNALIEKLRLDGTDFSDIEI